MWALSCAYVMILWTIDEVYTEILCWFCCYDFNYSKIKAQRMNTLKIDVLE